jgi:hypothetical protein
MNRVAPEIAKKIGVLFENRDFKTSAGEEQAKHHPGWAATDHTTGGFNWVWLVHRTRQTTTSFFRLDKVYRI